MFTCFDLNITEEEIDSAILDGHYVLQAYATIYWLDHVIEGIREDIGSTSFRILSQKIWRFLAKRSNQNFDQKSAKKVSVPELKQFEKIDKELYGDLAYIHSSVASELSEPLKASDKNSESLSCLCVARGSRSHRIQICRAFISELPIEMFTYFMVVRSKGTCSMQLRGVLIFWLLAPLSFALDLSIPFVLLFDDE